MRRVALAAVALLFVFAAAAGAQILKGNVIGSVRDESGAMLPGVTVTLSSPEALPGGPQETVTNERGEYRFPELFPGIYTLTANLNGFSRYQEQDLRVAVGSTTERIINLKVGALEETITVKGESPMVDPRRVGVTANLPQEIIEIIPTKRYGFHEYVKWVPGVAPSDPQGNSGSASVMGSSTGENLFLYEGVNGNSPVNGGYFTGGSPNAVEEVQVVALGASAEYQVAQGAVFNTVLKSGSNAFRFDGAGFLYPSGLTSAPIKLDCNCSLGTTGYKMVRRIDFSGSAGGPIVKDKLWFYYAYVYTNHREANPGVDYRVLQTSWNSAPFVKVDWQINPKHKFKGLYQDKHFANPPLPNVTRPLATLTTADSYSNMYNGELNSSLSGNSLLTVRITGTFVPRSLSFPYSGDTTTSFRLDSRTGVACCGVQNFGDSPWWRHVQAVKLSRYMQTTGTTHDLRFGFQTERAVSTDSRSLPGGANYSDLGGAPDQATFRDPYVQRAGYSQAGIWGEDQVTFGRRFTINLGARFDRMNAFSPDADAIDNLGNPTGATIAGLGDMFTWNVFAPRLGANYKLTDDGRTIVRGHYGRAYRQVYLDDFRIVHPGLSRTTTARWNPATNSYSTILSVVDPIANLRVDPDLKDPYTDSYSIGLDRELVANMSVGATYVHKRGEDLIGWKDTGGIYGTRTEVLADGRTLTVFPLLNATSARRFLRTNGDGTFTRYNGLVLTLDKRMSNRWTAKLWYTVGRSRGLTTTEQDPNMDINNDGRLSYDRPNMVVFVGAYDVPKADFQVSVNFMRAAGQPYAPQALVQLPQGRLSINIEKADGTYHIDTQELLWLRFTKSLFRHGARRLDLNAEIANALQDTAFDAVQTRNLFAANFGQGQTFVVPRLMFLSASFRF